MCFWLCSFLISSFESIPFQYQFSFQWEGLYVLAGSQCKEVERIRNRYPFFLSQLHLHILWIVIFVRNKRSEQFQLNEILCTYIHAHNHFPQHIWAYGEGYHITLTFLFILIIMTVCKSEGAIKGYVPWANRHLGWDC